MTPSIDAGSGPSGGRRGSRWCSRCDEIAREISDVRGDLILDLADAPRPVAGHSRVVDVEKALDNIETSLRDVRARLSETTSPPA